MKRELSARDWMDKAFRVLKLPCVDAKVIRQAAKFAPMAESRSPRAAIYLPAAGLVLDANQFAGATALI